MEPDPARILQELYDADDSKYFDDVAEGPLMGPPVVGVAGADDPWFARFKEIIGDFHWTAQEAFAAAFPSSRARSVISWSTPISGAAKLANRTESRFPSRQWALVRHHSTGLLERLAAGMVDTLQDMGFATVAPEQSPRFEVAMRENVGLAGQWSQRHVAFVAGLGTFGISGGLITAHGIAHRLCSVVTEAEIPPHAPSLWRRSVRMVPEGVAREMRRVHRSMPGRFYWRGFPDARQGCLP